MKRPVGTDLEASTNGRTINMMGAPPNIQAYQPQYRDRSEKNKGHGDPEGWKKAVTIAGVIWLGGWMLGYDFLWPLYLLLDILYNVLSIPPFSWLFGWVLTPFSWVYSWLYRGAPLISNSSPMTELRLPTDQVATYMDSYVQQFGDAALTFAAHDGYPQIVNNLLSHELGYADLIDASDDNGNTALIYACSKGYKQTTAALLRHGADPDVANTGDGGRTPLMESAGAGHKDIVSSLRLVNASVDAVDDFGNTALHYAAYHGHISVVTELLKANPRRDIVNNYGHTAASYAATNKHKAISDLLNRQAAKRSLAKDRGLTSNIIDDFDLDLPTERRHKAPEKHVKGKVEELHRLDKDAFAPKMETATGMTDAERKSLEDQVARLQRQHEEIELKSQRRIVELLERSSTQQNLLEEAETRARSLQLNNTELSLKVDESQSKHATFEQRALDERQRADRLHEEIARMSHDLERYRGRVEAAERERDLNSDASRRHEDNLRRKHDEVNEYVARIDRQAREISTLREDLRKREEEGSRYKLKFEESERGGTSPGGSSLTLASSSSRSLYSDDHSSSLSLNSVSSFDSVDHREVGGGLRSQDQPTSADVSSQGSGGLDVANDSARTVAHSEARSEEDAVGSAWQAS
eukprot:CAMPEP_0194531822 /NCGR_PEP_ID=MMETSP0253-20130528/69215_1 /TAXON_ID=2966 /ORGANISM="Noctiluca scintillans" /LENGTH=638 /DNA_ID=CAMNT_0039377209 /DNA_START=35 /DNA_END=1951 /DNA_ORIENTATION=-